MKSGTGHLEHQSNSQSAGNAPERCLPCHKKQKAALALKVNLLDNSKCIPVYSTANRMAKQRCKNEVVHKVG